ncbi:hypothetical protein KEM52_006299 [Ascosphaera acerosa]|nr:hypothetical protein KEM52_006299 [Ascosphaera acerosa]
MASGEYGRATRPVATRNPLDLATKRLTAIPVLNIETLIRLGRTILDPKLMLPLYLLSRYTEKGQLLAAVKPELAKWLKIIAMLGVAKKVHGLLNQAMLNNFARDKYVWDQEIAIVTGGSDGIGAKVSRILAERGVRVAVLDVKAPTYTTGPKIHFVHCDVTSKDNIKAAAAEVRATFGEPTILVNNAGILPGTSLLGSSDALTRKVFEINTLAHYTLAREFLPHMIKRDHGMVVTVASQAAFITLPNMIDYSGSKSAAMSFHEGLTAELRANYKAPRVRTIVLAPGFIRTSLIDKLTCFDSVLNPLLSPDHVAQALTRQIFSGQSGGVYLPEFSSSFIGRLMRALPVWIQRIVHASSEGLTHSSGH